MTAAIEAAREAWENEFREPQIEDLRGMYEESALFLYDAVRAGALALDGVTEELAWEGIPWRWCLRMSHPNDTGVFAYIAPMPTGPELCLPLTTECVESIPLRRLKRYARDNIVKAKKVGSDRWPSWRVNAKTELEELLDMLKRKHRFLTKKPS